MGDVSVGFSSSNTVAFNPYRFSAYRNSALTPSGSAVLTCDTKEFDPNGNLDIATNLGRYTCPVNGIYLFNGQIVTGSNRALIMLFKNGSEFKRGSDLPSGTSSNVTAIVSAVSGDFFEIFCNTSSTALTVGSAAFCYFQGFLISRG